MPSNLRFVYTGLRVRKLARSVAFYRRFGFRELARGRMEHGGRWVHLRFPGAGHRLELNYYPASNRFYEPVRRGTEFDHFGFFTDDLAAWRRRGARAGARLVAEFPERDRYRQVYFEDPDGNWIGAFGPTDRPREVSVATGPRLPRGPARRPSGGPRAHRSPSTDTMR